MVTGNSLGGAQLALSDPVDRETINWVGQGLRKPFIWLSVCLYRGLLRVFHVKKTVQKLTSDDSEDYRLGHEDL